MEVVIQATINQLGYYENGTYYQEPDCFESLRDLISFLRNDNNMLQARRMCGEHNIIESDLIPIIRTPKITERMFDICLRLMANLCQPALVSMQGKKPEDKDQWQAYWEVEQNLLRSKLAFADIEFFKAIKTKMEEYFMETEWDERTEENKLVMERVMILLRHIMSISASEKDGARTAMECSSHDRVVEAFLDSGLDTVLLHIGSTSKERDFHLSVLEIVALILKEHKPSDLVEASRGRTLEERQQADMALRKIVEAEQQKALATRRKMLSSRHSRFAGSYVVKGMQATNKENALLVTKAVKNLGEINFMDERKVKRRTPVNRRAFEGNARTHVSSVETRLKMKSFVERVLEKAYNRLVKNCKEAAFGMRRSLSQRSSDIHYMLLVRFCTEFVRVAGAPTEQISSTLGRETFHFVQIQLDTFLENAQTDKQKAKFYGLRAQFTLQAYKELVLILQYMLEKGTDDDKEFAQATCEHILKVEEYRDLGISLLRRFMPGVLSKTFLRELILSTHYYLRLLEKSARDGSLRVQKKQKLKKPRKKAEKKDPSLRETELATRAQLDGMDSEALDEKWTSIQEELENVIKRISEMNNDVIPINSLLEVEDQDHQRFLMLSIQRALREGKTTDAVGLYRAGRDVWPEGETFGKTDMSSEEEISEIKEIYTADLSEVAISLKEAEDAAELRLGSDLIDDGQDSEGEEEEIARYEVKEVDFDFTQYFIKFARTDVLRWYIFLLNDFRTNSIDLNKALIKMLHRVAYELKEPSRIFQLSLFRVLLEIKRYFDGLPNAEKKKSPFFEIYQFGFHLLKKFFSTYESIGPKLAAECLFWKGPRECYEIEHGYGSYEENRKESHQTWNEELEDEVRSLHREFLDMDERPQGMDILDFVEHNLTRPRTRKQIGRKLKEFGLDTLGAKMTKPTAGDFPVIEAKRLIENYNLMNEEQRGDMVDFLREELSLTHKEFGRAKILKQLAYLGVQYEKRPDISLKELRSMADRFFEVPQEDRGDLVDFIRGQFSHIGKEFSRPKIIKNLLALGIVYTKPGTEWSEGLLTELRALKEQVDEMEEDERQNISIADYVLRRLSEKKPRGQVENQLRALGVDIPKPERKTKVKSDNFTVSDGEESDNDAESEKEDELSANEDSNKDSDAESDDGMDYIRNLTKKSPEKENEEPKEDIIKKKKRKEKNDVITLKERSKGTKTKKNKFLIEKNFDEDLNEKEREDSDDNDERSRSPTTSAGLSQTHIENYDDEMNLTMDESDDQEEEKGTSESPEKSLKISPEPSEQRPMTPKSSLKKRKRVMSSSDEDEPIEKEPSPEKYNENLEDGGPQSLVKSPKQKKKRVIMSDSDDE